MWLRGRDEILAFWQGQGAECAGSRLLPTVANGKPAFGQYRRSATGGGHDAWALQVLDFVDGQLVELSWFLDTERLFPLFGLPAHLEP
jgi:RNA polymerase sigma-70 factor (ECF subfamily)